MPDEPPCAADLLALHDAELSLVAMDRDGRSVQLAFRTPAGSVQTIHFEETLTYRINNIQYQNVVSRAQVSLVSSDFDKDLERTPRWTCSGSSDDLLIPQASLLTHLERIREGGVQLFYIDPSWGAEIGVIARTITIARH